jgi:prophage regulatory protein
MSSAITIAGQPEITRIIRLQEVMHRTGLSKSTIYDRMKKKEFPQRVKLLRGSQYVGWADSEIDAYIASLMDARPKSPVEISDANETTRSAGLQTDSSRYAAHPRRKMTKPERPQQKLKAKVVSNAPGLLITGLKIEGYDEVYLQTATGKLFVEIGQMPASLMSLLVA